MKNLFYFVFVLSLLVVFWQSSTRRGVLVSWLFQHTRFLSFLSFLSNLSNKVFQNDKRKNFQKQTHTHTDIVVEKEKEKPRTRDDDNERGKR